MNDIAIEGRGLTKTVRPDPALDGLDLAARRGTVLGVLGPNGAGKTTAVRMLATLTRPDAGRPGSTASTSPRTPSWSAGGSASPGSTRRSTRT